ncbi:MAG: hypothetical protein Ct9H90mP25_3110 [Gammaproteobacteria bacterium]|nr:MAG: hypothetical protein Ct9H90mP25_3110 [Gammaproteobacteria bacterium]
MASTHFPIIRISRLVLTSGNLPRQIVAFIGAGSVGLSFIAAIFIAFEFLASGGKLLCKRGVDLDVCWRFQSGVQLLFGWFFSSDDACYHGSWVFDTQLCDWLHG